MPLQDSLYEIAVEDAKGQPTTLASFRGKPLLIVNVASKCLFTPQYEGLEKLYQAYKDRGLAIVGFPCNQFGSQEPGTNEEIQSFCKLDYGVSFPVMGKLDVNGPKTSPLYARLKERARGFLGTRDIKWNFTKFLVSKDGEVLSRYAPQTKPLALSKDIEKALGA